MTRLLGFGAPLVIAALGLCFGCALVERDMTSVVTNLTASGNDPWDRLDLTVVTFNVHDLYLGSRDRDARMREIGGALADLDPDVVSIQ